MRLPADAALIVFGDPNDAAGALPAEKTLALIEAWSREDLPAFFARDAQGDYGFARHKLQERLDEIGATTLVMCGESAAVEAALSEADGLGFLTFVVGDACWREPTGAALASPDAGRTVVNAETALAAAAVAKARERRRTRQRS